MGADGPEAPADLTLAIICVALGVVVFGSGLLAFNPDPRTWDTMTERLTELVVIVSLMGAGLKLDRPIGWRALGVDLAAAGHRHAADHRRPRRGWAWSASASAWRWRCCSARPSRRPIRCWRRTCRSGRRASGDEDEVRFGLTSEAGLNDALAFPFVHLAILAAAGGLRRRSASWANGSAIDVGWKLRRRLGDGLCWSGRALGFLIFHSRRARTVAASATDWWRWRRP